MTASASLAGRGAGQVAKEIRVMTGKEPNRMSARGTADVDPSGGTFDITPRHCQDTQSFVQQVRM